MIRSRIPFLFISTIVFDWAPAKELPAYIKPCKMTEVDLSQCLADRINGIRPQLAEGVAELGVPPLKLIEIPRMTLAFGGTSNMTIVFERLKFRGAEEFALDQMNVDWNTRTIVLDVVVPFFRTTADYHVFGRLILIDIDARGEIAMNFTNVQINSKMSGESYAKSDGEHWRFEADAFDVRIDGMSFELQGLIDGNRQLTEAINGAFTANARELLEQVRPAIAEAVQQLILAIVNGVFEKFPIDRLFPNE